MFQNLLGKKRTARTPFLVSFVRLSSRHTDDGRPVFVPQRGAISRLGFAEDHNSSLFGCAQPTKPEAQMFYTDKFVTIQAGDERGRLGDAELREAYVYDEHYRAEIDLTGLRLVLTLRQSAFEQYERFISNARVPASIIDTEAWHGDLLMLIPSPVFEFPRGRGSAPPYPPAETRGAKVGKLRTIRNFRFATIDIVKIAAQRGSAEPYVPDILKIPPENVLRLR